MGESIVARQPILNRNKKTIAYELLYRPNDGAKIINGSQATAEVIINSFNDIGINNLTSGKPAFINFTAELIKAEISELLPQKKVGIEILEDVELDQHLIDSSQRIKDSGHIILLDDFVYKDELIPLIEIADIIKIDFLETQGSMRKELIDFIKNKHNSDVKFLAEKIETHKEFKTAYDMGYDYFQGYFFRRPNTFINRKIPSYKFTYLEVINKLNQKVPDLKEITEVIKKDSSMTYSLLRTINAAAYGCKVSNLNQAAALLGTKRLKKWALLNFIKGLSSDKPDALFISSLVRGRMAELLALKIDSKKSEEFYTVGLLSMLDAYLDRNMGDIIEELAISEEIVKALVDKKGILGDILNMVISFEVADWSQLSVLYQRYGLDDGEVFECFTEAVQYADKTSAVFEKSGE